jgi:hypothetical protein
MGEEIFGEAPSQSICRNTSQTFQCKACGALNSAETGAPHCTTARNIQYRSRKRRRGNHYAQFTRKFSLGNGPPDWVSEYLVTKEGGKMLGTLVALALARMPSLETFVWDMPTGILRDVWLALSSLGDRNDGEDCRLERVWVRWHDNNDALMASGIDAAHATLSQFHTVTGIPPPAIAGALPPGFNIPRPQLRVEHPTFSNLPRLKSLTVLDIDEIAYLDDMAILIGRSKDRIKELRVGISNTALAKPWTADWDAEGAEQVDQDATWSGNSRLGEKRLGGVLGVLVGRVCDVRRKKAPVVTRIVPEESPVETVMSPQLPIGPPAESAGGSAVGSIHQHIQQAQAAQATLAAQQDALLAQLQSSDDIATAVEPGDDHINEMIAVAGSALAIHPQEIPPMPTSFAMPQTWINGMTIPPPSPTHSWNKSPTVQPPPPSNNTPPHSVFATVIPFSTSPPQSHSASTSETGMSAQNTPALSSTQSSNDLSGVSLSQPAVTVAPVAIEKRKNSNITTTDDRDEIKLQGKLKLEVLELERVSLSVRVLQKAFDWSVMTSITILNCPNHEHLWKLLRNNFCPLPPNSHRPRQSSSINNASYSSKFSKTLYTGSLNYQLNLKKIHTNQVSPALISFLRETLAPNSLEVLFLQEGTTYTSAVTIDSIYRGPIKRHRLSLKKLMIDSSVKHPPANAPAGSSSTFKKWMFPREVLGFVTSGRMTNIRELGMAIEYKDWVSLAESTI